MHNLILPEKIFLLSLSAPNEPKLGDMAQYHIQNAYPAACLLELVLQGFLVWNKAGDNLQTQADQDASVLPEILQYIYRASLTPALLYRHLGKKTPPANLQEWLRMTGASYSIHKNIGKLLAEKGLVSATRRRWAGLFPYTQYSLIQPDYRHHLIKDVQGWLWQGDTPSLSNVLLLKILYRTHGYKPFIPASHWRDKDYLQDFKLRVGIELAKYAQANALLSAAEAETLERNERLLDLTDMIDAIADLADSLGDSMGDSGGGSDGGGDGGGGD